MNNEHVPSGKHKDKMWSEVPKGYLEFIVNTLDHEKELAKLCVEEMKRRDFKHTELRILPQTIDSASFCCMDDWKYAVKEKGYTGGFYAYVTLLSKKALEEGTLGENDYLLWKKLKFKVKFGNLFPTIIKIEKSE